MAIMGVPAKIRVLAHAMQTHSRNQQSFCCNFARQRRWREAWVASHKVMAQLFHPYGCTKPFLCKAVSTDQPSGLTAISSPPIFVVQLYPVPGLLVNEESHETHLYSTGTCTVQAQGCK